MQMLELKNMRPLAKVAIVFFGFVLALAIAYIALKVYVARTAGPDREQYAAMFAFGDSLLFLGIFGDNVGDKDAVDAWMSGRFLFAPGRSTI
jgi:hypothetical protein